MAAKGTPMTPTLPTNRPSRQEITPWALAILVLSVVALVCLGFQSVAEPSRETQKLLSTLDFIICVFFLADFAIQLRKAPDKKRFWRWGWVDLISSIPAVDSLRWGRFARVGRILRVLRGYRSVKEITRILIAKRDQSASVILFIFSGLALTFGAIAILECESGMEGANIQTAPDALWWSFVTITTVGCGDFYPVTTEGRFVAAVLMAVGVGLFGTFTAYLATALFTQEEEVVVQKEDLILEKLNHLETQIQEIRERVREETPSSSRSRES